MEHKPINFKEKFALFNETWSPKIIAQLNDYHFKIAKIKGEFVWHSHVDTDEAFIIIEGKMKIHLRDEVVPLRAGEMLVVPHGIDHKPVAMEECQILMIELAGTVNTGDAGGDRTVERSSWI